jgi:hypothetical protein
MQVTGRRFKVHTTAGPPVRRLRQVRLGSRSFTASPRPKAVSANSRTTDENWLASYSRSSHFPPLKSRPRGPKHLSGGQKTSTAANPANFGKIAHLVAPPAVSQVFYYRNLLIRKGVHRLPTNSRGLARTARLRDEKRATPCLSLRVLKFERLSASRFPRLTLQRDCDGKIYQRGLLAVYRLSKSNQRIKAASRGAPKHDGQASISFPLAAPVA